MAARGFARRSSVNARARPAGQGHVASGARTNALSESAWSHVAFGDPLVHSSGQPLSPEARAFFEPRFGHDFGDVRVHTDAAAARQAASLSAHAFAYGRDLYFGGGAFAPSTTEGRALIAHELAHVVQQRAGEPRIARASYNVGASAVHVDYGDVVGHDHAREYLAQLKSRLAAWTGQPAKVFTPKLARLNERARRWLLFAVDVVADNPTATLEPSVATTRLIDYAPTALRVPLGDRRGSGHYYAFENEALRASGWFEEALTSKLTAPGKEDQAKLDPLYGQGDSRVDNAAPDKCPSPRPTEKKLDVKTLTKELDRITRASLAEQAGLAKNLLAGNDTMANARSLADIVQDEALRFFTPFIGASHTRMFQQGWKYSANLTDLTAPKAIPVEARYQFIDTHARDKAESAGLLKKVNFDARCEADQQAFDAVIKSLDADPEIQGFVAAVQSWIPFTGQDNPGDQSNVRITTQRRRTDSVCESRWRMIETLCHELMHVYVSEDFYALHNYRLLIKEGFPEVLGDQLYDHLRFKAMRDRTLRDSLQTGLGVNACAARDIPGSHASYGAAAQNAEEVRKTVGDERFRAAFFLGKPKLAGLEP